MKSWNDPTFTDKEKNGTIAVGLGYTRCSNCTVFETWPNFEWNMPHFHSTKNERFLVSKLPDWLHDDVLAFAEVASHLPDGTDLRLYPSKNKVLIWGPDGKFICSGITAQTICYAFYELVCVKEVPDGK